MKLKPYGPAIALVLYLAIGGDHGAQAAEQAMAATADGVATEVCAVLHELPAQRKQACCGSGAGNLAQICRQELSAALKRGSVRVDRTQIEQCRKATSTALTGCAWVGPLLPDLPAACGTLIRGELKTGANCRSSLECQDGLYCRGVTPLGSGVCAAPAQANARCEIPADNLRAFARAMDDPRHPTCDGVCLKGQCLPHVPAGAACTASTICAAGLNCIDGRCAAQALPALGQACTGSRECAGDAVCDSGYCRAPKGAGQSCKLPFECRSLECQKSPGADSGVCADVCAASSGPKAFPL